MTARTDFLTILTNAGYTPSMAFTFEEGSGTPQEFYGTVGESIGGTPVWGTNGTYGAFWSADSTNDAVRVPNNPDKIGTTKQTVIVAIRKTDTTPRQHSTFAVDSGTNGIRCDAQLPWNDGIIYWNYGGVTEPNTRLTAPWTKDTNTHVWVFKAGPAGMSIWKDGVQFDTTATANPGRTTNTTDVVINAQTGTVGDLQEFYELIFIKDEVSDAFIAANCTPGIMLLGVSTPQFDTTSLPDGAIDEDYSETVEVSEGFGDLTITLTSGALPDGLSLDGTTGVISGTLTATGLFHFTLTVTDELTHTGEQDFTIFVDDPLCQPEGVGAVVRGSFAANSRVGPFDNGAKITAGIFKDYGNAKKLLAQYSTNGGITWTEVRTSALTNDIGSFDAHQTADDMDTIHVAVQESTSGRVSYFVFNLISGAWTLESQTVLASATPTTSAVSMTVLSGGDPMIAYAADDETVVFTGYKRISAKRRVGGVWGTAIEMGDYGLPQSDIFGRLIAGLDDRAIMFMTVSPGYFVGSTADFQHQIYKSDATLSTPYVYLYTGLSGSNPAFWMGDYTTYQSGSDFIIAIPFKWGGSPTVFLFIDSDTMMEEFQEIDFSNFVGESASAFVPFVLRYVDGELHSLDWGWSSLGADSFIRHKIEALPVDMADQTGPTMGPIQDSTQQMDGNIVQRTCNGVTSTYVATFVAVGTVDDLGDSIKYEWIKLDDLPTDPTLTLEDWLTNLETQVIDFCCTESEPPESAIRSVEILRGSILEADWLKRDLYGANAAVNTPLIFTLEVADKLKLSQLPPPNAVKGLDYIYVPQPTTLTVPTDATTQDIPLPADFIPFLKFGVLADLFLKSGEAHDPARGKVCQDMYELGLEIARVYVAGINS